MTASGISAQENPIRVCYLAHYTAGGSATSLLTLLRRLDRNLYTPTVILHRVKNPALVTALKRLEIPTSVLVSPRSTTGLGLKVNLTARLGEEGLRGRLLNVYRAIRAAGRTLVRDARWIPQLASQLRGKQPHLVHCNNGLRAHRLDLLLCAIMGIPTVCHVRNFETLTAVERLAARTVGRFIFISHAVAESYQQQGILPQRGTVIPNAVGDEAFLHPDPAPRVEFGWESKHFVAVNVGRLVPWKGQDVFLKAVAQLAPQMPHLRALIVGKADDNDSSRAFEKKLHRLAQDLGIADKVIFAGHRNDALQLMAGSDAVVHSAVTPEPFGRVVIEAMAAKRPIVATAAGGVLDVVTHDVTGLLVPPGEEDALAAALDCLATKPSFAAQLADAGQDHAAKQFTATRHASQISTLYQNMLSRNEGTISVTIKSTQRQGGSSTKPSKPVIPGGER